MPRKITAPIARSTAYDFNTQLSHSHLTDYRRLTGLPLSFDCTNDDERNVMPHEFLFEEVSKKSQQRIRAKSSLNGVQISEELVSTVNKALGRAMFDELWDPTSKQSAQRLLGLWKTRPADQQAIVNRALNSFFRYVGVAVTGCQAGSAGALQRQGFSATRGGLMTVLNTGTAAIPAGAHVRIELDFGDILSVHTLNRRNGVDLDGVPASKIVARLVKVDAGEDILMDMHEAPDGGDRGSIRWTEPAPLLPGLSEVARLRFPLSE